MAGCGLLGELPEQAEPGTDAPERGTPRLREPRRDQVATEAKEPFSGKSTK